MTIHTWQTLHPHKLSEIIGKFTAPTTREFIKIFISDRDSIFSKPVLSGQTADLHM